jgi:hypothetical protein
MPDPPPSLNTLSYAPSAARQSRAGLISFACGLIAILSLCLSLIAIKRPLGSAPVITRLMAILIFTAFVGVLLLGMVTGILGVLPPRRNRGLAIAGLILNGLISLFILLLIVAASLGRV